MAVRPSVLETLQLGAESTAGTLVSAGKRIQSLELDVDPIIPSEMAVVQGWKAPTGIVTQKESAKGSGKGMLDFNALVYWLCGFLKNVSPTTPTTNGTFTVSLGAPSAGTFTLTFNGQTTATIAFNAAASAVLSALEALSTIGSGNVTVSGGAGGPYTVTFTAALQRTGLALTGSGAGLTGGTFNITSTAASTARRWTFLPDMTGADTIKTYSLEKGAGSNAGRATFAHVTDMDLEFTTKNADLKLEMAMQEWTDGITMTGSPADIANQPVSPDSLDVYVGTTLLGLTKLASCFKASWRLKDRWGPKFTLNTDEPSFSDVVERMFNATAQLVLEQDSVANAFMTDLRNKTTKFCRIVATGPTIETGWIYRVQLTFPFKFRNPKRGDSEGIYSGTYDVEPIYSSSLGGSIEIVVDNIITAL